MRGLIAVCLLLVSTGLLAARAYPGADSADLQAAAAESSPADWRRTADGWQRKSTWSTSSVDETAGPDALAPWANLHPLVVAALQVLISLGALVCTASLPARTRNCDGNLTVAANRRLRRMIASDRRNTRPARRAA